MKILLIDASPKHKNSGSGCILAELKKSLNGAEIIEYGAKKPQIDQDIMQTIEQVDALVFAFPLYVDGIPSHLLHCMRQIQLHFASKKPHAMVYAISNSGFFEAHQNTLALEMMKNWCSRTGFTWGQGFAMGGGGMSEMLPNLAGKGPMKNVSLALQKLSQTILQQGKAETIFVTPGFPRHLYKMAAEMGWRQQIKMNGLKTKDLFRQK